jgi:phosphatidylinositol alpha-1,6-mannosyltransferase
VKKTLLLSEVFPPRIGGSGRYLYEVYRQLPPERVAAAAGEAPGQEAFDAAAGLKVFRLPLTFPTWGLASRAGLRSYWRAFRTLGPWLKAGRFERLHAGKCLPEGMLAWLVRRRHGLPYLCTVHGEEMNLATTSRELACLTRRVLGGAEFLIANSHNTERILCTEWGLPAERIRVLHPGVDARRFVPAARDPGVRARLGWGDRPVVLTISRLQKRKGQDCMIRALSAVRQRIPDVLYAIVGDGEERPELQAQTAAAGLGNHVQFLGGLDEEALVPCYQQCDLFVLPNRQVGRDIEGFGIVLLEAQACGKPVVAGASGGTAETLRVPDTGRVVPCDGPDELAAAVGDLLADPARLAAMGAAARRWVVERFDWQARGHEVRRIFGAEHTTADGHAGTAGGAVLAGAASGRA